MRARTPPDPLDLIHALTTQIPDSGQHMVRCYGWYSNRSRAARASWARLLRRIFEVDPLLCPACGSAMKIVSVIREPNVIDAILRHLARTGGRDPFEGRAPPAA